MTRIMSLAMCLLISLSFTTAYAEEKTKKELKEIAKEQKAIRKMRSATLKELYKEKPEAKQEVLDSVAVAAFSSTGINLFLFATQRGGGIVRETKSGNETFMRMFSLGGGLGLGVKSFKVIFVFHTQSAYDNFLNSGWDFSGSADAAAKSGDQGAAEEAAATVVSGVSLYQFTKAGLALQATLLGTKYYKDENLN